MSRKTIGLADLAQSSPVVETSMGNLPVYPLRLAQIANLILRHAGLADAFGSKDPAKIAGAILGHSESAVNAVLEAATRSKPGTAEDLDIHPLDEAKIIKACIENTLPRDKDELGKFQADVESLLTRFGLTIPWAGQTSSNN